jgi:16S rRNA (cytidine1402-2'-O)-methyltransferase
LEKNNNEQKSKGTLFIVSTPIGNKKDITYRAAEILQNADIIVGEEIKETSRLLMNLTLSKPIELLNEHNEIDKIPELMDLLLQGKTLALVSDCGTPVFADPGERLVRACLEKKININVIPGVTSIMTALVRSGFSLKQFLYAGFLSRISEERENEITQLAKVRKTVVLLDTPYRLKIILEAFAKIIPERNAYIGMNLTMPSETHHYGTFQELYSKLKNEKFKAEYVLVFEGGSYYEHDERTRMTKFVSRNQNRQSFNQKPYPRKYQDEKFEKRRFGDKPSQRNSSSSLNNPEKKRFENKEYSNHSTEENKRYSRNDDSRNNYRKEQSESKNRRYNSENSTEFKPRKKFSKDQQFGQNQNINKSRRKK